MIVLRGFYVQWQTLTLTAKLGFSVVFLEDRWILCSVVILTNIDFYCEIRFFSFILGPWGSVAAGENWSETKLSSVLVNIGVPERQHHNVWLQAFVGEICLRKDEKLTETLLTNIESFSRGAWATKNRGSQRFLFEIYFANYCLGFRSGVPL